VLTGVQELHLYSNNFGAEGATSLAHALGLMSVMTWLKVLQVLLLFDTGGKSSEAAPFGTKEEKIKLKTYSQTKCAWD
jgi:hypothetical protein